jgi:wobble nucleotide-excising tRNase
MLEKIIALENVGLFLSGAPKGYQLSKATLVYADNARGKSTLSAILQACAANDCDGVTARATIGAKGPPVVRLRFQLATGGTNVTFENGKWNTAVLNLQVFDQGFVERNVYAGSEVHPDHHQALLDFAIGSAAVAKKKEFDDHSAAQVAATRARSAAEDKMRGYMGQTPLADFLALPKEDDPDTRIADLERRIEDARAAAAIAERRGLSSLSIPTNGLVRFGAVLAGTFEQLHENAQAVVQAHVEKHGGRPAERWVSEGLPFHTSDACPFCGQGTEGLELIAAYKTYFNAAYAAYMRDVAALPGVAASQLAEPTIAAWEAECRANVDRAAAWSAQVKFECPSPDFAALRGHATMLRTKLEEAAALKALSPLSAVDPAIITRAGEAWASVERILTEYNRRVATANDAIAAFKKELAGENKATLESQLATVRLRRTRHSPEVGAMVEERRLANERRSSCETAKNTARQELDALMRDVLSRYQAGINRWLGHFGAPFRVGDLGFTYQGGTTPRTEYAILLRGRSVVAGRKNTKELSFQSVLSDGDKRALALAFFLARVQADAGSAASIVVLDDVFASLDKHRRLQTMVAVGELTQQCTQVIVMGHDAYFLRDLARRLAEKKLAEPLTLQIRRAADDFSELDECDLTELCASTYYKRYREVDTYLAGASTPNLLPVAQALRPLVEGSLHRRFPGLIKDGVTFGVVLDQIKSAPAGHPLAALQPQLPALAALNDFVGQFHHDTAGVVLRDSVADSELHPFAKQAMSFVQMGTT